MFKEYPIGAKGQVDAHGCLYFKQEQGRTAQIHDVVVALYQ